MKSPLRWALLALLPLPFSAAPAWQEVTMPTVAEAAAAFPKPPREFGAIDWMHWGGPQTKEHILADIRQIEANGVYVIMIGNSRGLSPKYFTSEYLDLVKFTIEECKKRGMKVWIEGDAGYPDGFAGGIISRDYPQLGMQGIFPDARYWVAAGQTLKVPVPPDTLGILAYNRLLGTTILPLPADGQFQWTAPDELSAPPDDAMMSEVLFVRHMLRSTPTRYTNREDGTNDKDSLYSVIDYLDPDATRTYLKVIHGTYEKLVGDEFGKTILGFRGDETAYTGFLPWTPKLLEIFKEVKGYDLQPYIPRFYAPELTPEVMRVKADYWDVWSSLFRDNFYKLQADWCAARGMEYMVHLNHEETMLNLNLIGDMVRCEGSFFRDMRYVQVPGVDNLNQIGPGIVADFPKIAASAAHLFGHPQVWEEEGGGLNQAGKFVADYNFVRGMNFLNLRGMNNPPPEGAQPLLNPVSAMAWYVNRASYLLATGRPAARVALYHPTDSLWLNDKESDTVTVKLVTELMEHQIDFDHIDLDALASVCTLEGGGLRNLSGQVYKAVIVPTSTVIDKRVLERLRAFAAGGGKVIFVGRTPSMVIDRTFLHPEPGAPDLSFATLEPTPEITDRVVAALPEPDVALDAPCAPIKYIHRSLQDGEAYFFFNESDKTQARTATLAGNGQVQVWDANSGAIHPLAGVAMAGGKVAVPLTLEPYETRFVVIGPLPADAGEPFPTVSGSQAIADLGGDWSISLGERQFRTPLKTWEELGVSPFNGTAHYSLNFSAPTTLPPRKRIYLDLGNVHEIALVRLNGVEFDARAWPPYLWDVTETIKGGANALEVQVQVAATEGQRTRGPAFAFFAPENQPQNLAPLTTGVPGGIGGSDPFTVGIRSSGGFVPSAPPLGAPAKPAGSGLLGPVRLFSQ